MDNKNKKTENGTDESHTEKTETKYNFQEESILCF